jgi:hypothetical protein
MGGLIQPSPAGDTRETNWTAIAVGLVAVLLVVGAIALLSRGGSKVSTAPHPYASKLKISGLKMSAAENFVGASVTYIEGTMANAGDKTVTHATVHVIFRNSMGQVVGDEVMPLHVLQTTGPYLDSVDLNASPLAPGQSKPFRLTFEHISSDWNQELPELQVTDVTVK